MLNFLYSGIKIVDPTQYHEAPIFVSNFVIGINYSSVKMNSRSTDPKSRDKIFV